MLKTLLISSALGGLVSLDTLVAFQFMVSRPLVAATLTGLALGEPGAGLSLGCLMELIWVAAVPVGSLVPPDFGLAAVFASAAAVWMRQSDPRLDWEACVVWALLWSLPYASLAGLADQWQRRWQKRLWRGAEAGLRAGLESSLGRGIFISLALTLGRGILLTAMGALVLFRPMLFVLARVISVAHDALDRMYWFGLLLGFMVALDLFWDRRWLGVGALSFAVATVALYSFGVSGSSILAATACAALVAATVLERRSRA